MNKLLTIAILLSACTRDAKVPNKAEIIVLSQAPESVCDTATTVKQKIDVVVCKTPKADVVAIYSLAYPFQVFAVKSVVQIKEEEAAAKKAEVAPAPVAPTPAEKK